MLFLRCFYGNNDRFVGFYQTFSDRGSRECNATLSARNGYATLLRGTDKGENSAEFVVHVVGSCAGYRKVYRQVCCCCFGTAESKYKTVSAVFERRSR